MYHTKVTNIMMCFMGGLGLISRDVYDDTNIMSRANGPSYDVSPHLRKSVCVITFFFFENSLIFMNPRSHKPRAAQANPRAQPTEVIRLISISPHRPRPRPTPCRSRRRRRHLRHRRGFLPPSSSLPCYRSRSPPSSPPSPSGRYLPGRPTRRHCLPRLLREKAIIRICPASSTPGTDPTSIARTPLGGSTWVRRRPPPSSGCAGTSTTDAGGSSSSATRRRGGASGSVVGRIRRRPRRLGCSYRRRRRRFRTSR